jgi:hypothetical protein
MTGMTQTGRVFFLLLPFVFVVPLAFDRFVDVGFLTVTLAGFSGVLGCSGVLDFSGVFGFSAVSGFSADDVGSE